MVSNPYMCFLNKIIKHVYTRWPPPIHKILTLHTQIHKEQKESELIIMYELYEWIIVKINKSLKGTCSPHEDFKMDLKICKSDRWSFEIFLLCCPHYEQRPFIYVRSTTHITLLLLLLLFSFPLIQANAITLSHGHFRNLTRISLFC